MMRVLAWLTVLATVPALGSVPDSTVNLRPWTRATTWDIELAPAEEPGPRLEMSGHLLGPDGRPAAGVQMYVYHADGRGWYARRGQVFNRIAGVLRTNDRGEYRFRSILPGRYEGSGGHVHFEVWEGERPRRSTFVGLYAAPGVPPPSMWLPSRTATREWSPHVALITVDSAGVYHCHHDLAWRDMAEVGAGYDSLMQAMRKQYGPAGR